MLRKSLTQVALLVLGSSIAGSAAADRYILHEEMQDTFNQYVIELRDHRRAGIDSDVRIGAQCPDKLVSYVERDCRPSFGGPAVGVSESGDERLTVEIGVQGWGDGAASFDRLLLVRAPGPAGLVSDALRVTWNRPADFNVASSVFVTLVSGSEVDPYLAILGDIDTDEIVAGQDEIISLYKEYGFEDSDRGPFLALPFPDNGLGWVASLRLVPDTLPEPLSSALAGTALIGMALAMRGSRRRSR